MEESGRGEILGRNPGILGGILDRPHSKISQGNRALNLDPNPFQGWILWRNTQEKVPEVTPGAGHCKNVFGGSSTAKIAPKIPSFLLCKNKELQKIPVFRVLLMKGSPGFLGWNWGFSLSRTPIKKKKAISGSAEKILPPHLSLTPGPQNPDFLCSARQGMWTAAGKKHKPKKTQKNKAFSIFLTEKLILTPHLHRPLLTQDTLEHRARMDFLSKKQNNYHFSQILRGKKPN